MDELHVSNGNVEVANSTLGRVTASTSADFTLMHSNSIHSISWEVAWSKWSMLMSPVRPTMV